MSLLDRFRRWRRQAPLWLWVGLRMSALAVSTVMVIAFGMWCYFNIRDNLILSQLPPAARAEIEQLREQPDANETRLWQLFQRYYNVKNFLPGLANRDWWMLIAMVTISIPVILLCGLFASRPLSRQFLHVVSAARRVSDGDFGARSQVVVGAPGELTALATDFNAMSAKLQQYERELRESSAMLAHELRTPLNAAMGRVQGMLDEVFPLEPEQLRLVHRQLEQINRLIGDLHLVSLARAGQLVLEPESVDLHELVAERIEWAGPALREAQMTIHSPTHPPLRLRADRHRLGQVLSILIDNALRYAAAGKLLEIEVRRDGSSVQLTLGDRGPGVEPAQLPHLLDRFWRADSSRARHSGGSGLGLAIASAICQAHDGRLVVSNRPGGGLLASVQLPLRR
ncbi:ATP-binding protein [Xanthomonas prunicola]|uniref:histidine kinase n=1 Tax=Xanthomonas prunicola TaxID=2053930 RepID=A0A9Q9MR21_9XANT|nr:ATP-binding protein [Xanthomonas prunicola]USI99849.1 ATP-binding protein [Xanthomonas prunicola]UXA48311.1 ATP-binding protein [Xanthomonas prunicola]UXA53850.1 ATP-binding protein [Xanthomonas prunicola]UXA56773.1 ATP-binding protein [Xanthomonas prunicola]UXA62733.1 ATP-binding protein [Xanthomonas prunicola]